MNTICNQPILVIIFEMIALFGGLFLLWAEQTRRRDRRNLEQVKKEITAGTFAITDKGVVRPK